MCCEHSTLNYVFFRNLNILDGEFGQNMRYCFRQQFMSRRHGLDRILDNPEEKNWEVTDAKETKVGDNIAHQLLVSLKGK